MSLNFQFYATPFSIVSLFSNEFSALRSQNHWHPLPSKAVTSFIEDPFITVTSLYKQPLLTITTIIQLFFFKKITQIDSCSCCSWSQSYKRNVGFKKTHFFDDVFDQFIALHWLKLKKFICKNFRFILPQ